MESSEIEIAIIGGGVVGLSLAYGLQCNGRRVTVFDQGENLTPSFDSNFGLIWVQGAGDGILDYARMVRWSAALWPGFAKDLFQSTGIDLELAQNGGIEYYLNDADAEAGQSRMQRLHRLFSDDYNWQFMSANELRAVFPGIGAKVVGATFCPEDGHLNPHALLNALHTAFFNSGGKLLNQVRVQSVAAQKDGFLIDCGKCHHAVQIVLCAGLDNNRLGPMVGMHTQVIVKPRQILISEPLPNFMHYPSPQLCQASNGAVLIGEQTKSIADDSTNLYKIQRVAEQAVSIYPELEKARINRFETVNRVLSPDGYPIYAQSTEHPGASLINCHNGVTLAAIHARTLPGWIDGSYKPAYIEKFSEKRKPIPSPT